jgi:hypothetical protein
VRINLRISPSIILSCDWPLASQWESSLLPPEREVGGKCAAAGAMVHLVRSGTYLPPALIVIYRPLTSAPIFLSISVWGRGEGGNPYRFRYKWFEVLSSSKDLRMRSIVGGGRDLSELCLTANVQIATVLGSISASSDTMESVVRQKKQC